MKHIRNASIAIRPVDASHLPQIAIAGASHHEKEVRRILESALDIWSRSGDFDAPHGLSLDPNVLSFHIRSFFWEAFAATDMILQWVNEVLRLGLDPAQVRWSDIRVRKSKTHPQLWSSLLPVLESYRESEEFFEISTYRHLSHSNFLVSQSLLSRDKRSAMLALETARVGQPVEDVRMQFPRYLGSLTAHTQSVANHVAAVT